MLFFFEQRAVPIGKQLFWSTNANREGVVQSKTNFFQSNKLSCPLSKKNSAVRAWVRCLKKTGMPLRSTVTKQILFKNAKKSQLMSQTLTEEWLMLFTGKAVVNTLKLYLIDWPNENQLITFTLSSYVKLIF